MENTPYINFEGEIRPIRDWRIILAQHNRFNPNLTWDQFAQSQKLRRVYG